MKRKQLKIGEGFRVAIGNERSQAAEMVIPPGDAEGDPENRHDGADQWLFVVAGTGRASGCIAVKRNAPLQRAIERRSACESASFLHAMRCGHDACHPSLRFASPRGQNPADAGMH